MKRKTYIALLVVAAAVFAALRYGVPAYRSYFRDDFLPRSEEPVLAFFDHAGHTFSTNASGIQHYSLIWKNTAFSIDKQAIQNVLNKGDVLITIETWLKGLQAKDNVLQATLDGTFDKKTADLAVLIRQGRHRVYIRWNPDMEVPVFVYPWQYQSAVLYRQAFNYFAAKLKHLAPEAKLVWGPSGFPGDTEYWPGDKLTDFASITLGSVSEYSTNAYPFAKSVPEILKQKIHRMRFIGKPLLILGTTRITPASFQSAWLQGQEAYMKQYDDQVYSPQNYVDTARPKAARTLLKFGVFDPNQKLLSQPQITIEHLFTDLGQVERGAFEQDLKKVASRHHEVIVTFEPWKDTSKVADTNVVKNILKKRYDAVFHRLFSILATYPQTVYLRFMHEMEIPIHRYAWQSQDPVQYIKAYRYFMQFEGGPGKNVKKVWGPAGDRASIDFWPGSDVVDYISIAIYGLPDKNITDPNQQEPFSAIFDRKFYRMRFADRPLFITEFGVKGPESYQDKWLANAAATLRKNKHVFGVSYFNLYDNPKAWGNIKAPDWSITPRSMQKFLQAVNGR